MPDTRKLKDKASKYLRDNKLRDALKLYEEVLAHKPDEVSCRMKVGDIYRRMGQPEPAIGAYQKVAEAYAHDGMLLKGIAVCKLILGLDSSHTETQQLLADLYSEKETQRRPAERMASVSSAPKDPIEDELDILPAVESTGDIPVGSKESTSETNAASNPVPIVQGQPVDSETSEQAPSGGPHLGAGIQSERIPLFSELPREAFIELLVDVNLRDFLPGANVVREGERGESFFVLASGRVRVTRRQGERDVTLAHLTEGAFFGEMALLQNGPRTASVVVEEPSQVLELSRVMLSNLVEKYPSVGQTLHNFYRHRLLTTVMATSPLFLPFDDIQRRELMRHFKGVNCASNDYVLREGEHGDGLFLVLSGQLKVLKNGAEAEPLRVGSLVVGDLFGETSLLFNRPASASVQAETQCHLLKLPRKQFEEVILTHPHILELVSDVSESRKKLNDVLVGDREDGELSLVLV